MPFIGLSVSDWAYLIHSTVIGLGAADVAEQDRRLHAARAVGLHPAELAERVAVELLAEVFDHVVALGLAVHEHVQSQRFLLAHAAGDFRLHGCLVSLLRLISPALNWLRAWRISAVCGNEPMVVVGNFGSFSSADCLAARWRIAALAFAEFAVDFGDGRLDRGVVDARRVATRCDGGSVGFQLGLVPRHVPC